MAHNLASYLKTLFGENENQRALVRMVIRIERRKHLFEKIQTNDIDVDSRLFTENAKFDLNNKESNCNPKYDFSNIKTISKHYF